MDMPVSTALGNYLQSNLTECIAYIVLLPILLLCWKLSKLQLENIKSFWRRLTHLFVWHHGLVFPLMLLTLFLLLSLNNRFIEDRIQEITKYAIPIIAFIFGDLRAQYRSEKKRVETYRKALQSMRTEGENNVPELRRSIRELNQELQEIDEHGNSFTPIVSPAPCDYRFLEVFLNDARCSWGPGTLYNDASNVFHSLQLVNRAFERREEIIDRLESLQGMQQQRAFYFQKLDSHNRKTLLHINGLYNRIVTLHRSINNALFKQGAEFLELIEF